MTTKILMIGQAPSRTGDPSRPLEGRIGRMLAGLAGMSFKDYLSRTERINLFSEWMGKAGKGDAWDAPAARERASELAGVLPGRTVLLLGRHIARAFGRAAMPWMTWEDAFGGRLAVIPHPSGIVLWGNSRENRVAASAFLRKAFE